MKIEEKRSQSVADFDVSDDVKVLRQKLRRLTDENGSLRRTTRRLFDRNARAHDQGFLAAVEMLEAGATLERLREAVVDFDADDTAPIEVP